MDIHVFVAEDDPHIGDALRAFLLDAGYYVELCADGQAACERLREKKFHLVILDIMLPGMNGQEILKEFRKSSDTPVLMITALSGEDSQLRAFDNLADDYVQKPFSMQVLMKRVEALLRRSGTLRAEIRLGDLCLNRETFKASWKGKELPLTLKEFEILELLLGQRGRVVSYESIITKIWGYDYYADDRIIHTHMRNIRAKLPVNIIKTIWKVGYTIDGAEA